MKKLLSCASLLSLIAFSAAAQTPAQEDRLEDAVKKLETQVERLEKIQNITGKNYKWYCCLDTKGKFGSPIKKFGSPIMKFSSRLFEAEGNTKLQATNKVIKECREDLTTQLNDKKRFLFDGDVQYSSMAEVIEQGCVEENVKCANADSDNE